MTYDPDKHHRHSIRLKEYDYSQPGAYFVTICTRERECLFGHVVNGEMRLNEAGEIARCCWEDIPDHFPLVELDAFVIMPNHVHGIIVIHGAGRVCPARTEWRSKQRPYNRVTPRRLPSILFGRSRGSPLRQRLNGPPNDMYRQNEIL